jgi:hypothetical protein
MRQSPQQPYHWFNPTFPSGYSRSNRVYLRSQDSPVVSGVEAYAPLLRRVTKIDILDLTALDTGVPITP